MPKITAIIVTYNYGRFLKESIESIFHQGYGDLEVIVIDDGSTDNTEGVMRQYPEVLYIQQAHAGISRARNLGVSMATGEYIAFLDADDLWCENKLNSQIKFFEEYPKTEIIFGLYRNFFDDDSLQENKRAQRVFSFQGKESLVTGLIKKSTFEKIGIFKETLSYGEDTDWFMRCRLFKVNMHYTSQVMTKRRLHGKNMSLVSDAKSSDSKKILAGILREKIYGAKR